MSKYYTPKIEEFHVGFECEYQNIENAVWGLFKHPNLDSLPLDHELECIRVKYLDREDIESLGFNTEDNGECYNLQIGFDLYGIYPWESNKIHIIKDMKTLFEGIIKNKSELKKLLIQLSILEDGEKE